MLPQNLTLLTCRPNVVHRHEYLSVPSTDVVQLHIQGSPSIGVVRTVINLVRYKRRFDWLSGLGGRLVVPCGRPSRRLVQLLPISEFWTRGDSSQPINYLCVPTTSHWRAAFARHALAHCRTRFQLILSSLKPGPIFHRSRRNQSVASPLAARAACNRCLHSA